MRFRLAHLKVVIENYPDGQVEQMEVANNPEDPSAGTRKVAFARELFIERDVREVALDWCIVHGRVVNGSRLKTVAAEIAVDEARLGTLAATVAASGGPRWPVATSGHRYVPREKSSCPTSPHRAASPGACAPPSASTRERTSSSPSRRHRIAR